MRSLLEVLNRRPWLVVLATGALCLAAATQIVDFATGQPRLLVDTSVGSLIPQDDEGRRFYDRVKELFGTDDTILVVLVDDDVFRFENLERVQRLTERFEELARIQALEGKTWNHPVVVDGVIYLRNAEEAAAYRLPM